MTAFNLFLDYSKSYFFFLAFFFAFFLVAFFFAFFFAILVPPCKKSFMRTHSASSVLVCILIASTASFNKKTRTAKKIYLLTLRERATYITQKNFLEEKTCASPCHALQSILVNIYFLERDNDDSDDSKIHCVGTDWVGPFDWQCPVCSQLACG